jgi:hypothetical protein
MGRTCIADHRPEHSLGNSAWRNGCAQCEIERLRVALDQLLDDMGPDGHCVCEDAKQQAIEALRPNVAIKPRR